MDTQKINNLSLEIIPANRRLIEELSSHQMIDDETREYALELLYPAKNWGLWTSRLLLILGVALILSGIVYFFAFNWAKITPAMKLGSIQLTILVCLGIAYFYNLQQLSGKILLLSAAVLVGVFLAVFGQIYQTGADAYQLFMLWAVLILPWVAIAEFAALWLVWLVICNIFLILYWDQAVFPEHATEMLIISYLALFNGLFLGLREYFFTKIVPWLEGQWTRVVLVVPILGYLMIPTMMFIIEPGRASFSIFFGTLLAAITHIVFYLLYRYQLPDMWGLATTILSACIILESVIFKGITEVFDDDNAFAYLLMGGITLGIFTFAIVKLRFIAKEMESHHV
jgi:uncharacterized membrane protein